jgi:ubiquinone/menaquinone biosynthesis C-methylase UbiE/protein tyrosine phosphatase (PTP) superfamily phosphohydrolase (DUF442 family)
VHQCGDLFLAGQFAKDDIETIVEQEITRVITLRTEGEIDWDEKSALEAANMELVEVPFRSPDSLTDEVFDKVRMLLKDQSKKTLFHCGSANRVGGVWLPYRVLDQGVDLETALAEAKEIGLQTKFIEEKAIDYIKRHQATSSAVEPSVKPGINQSYLDPNLDVDAFIKRFEIESREIFICRERILAACEIQKGETIADVGAGTGLFTKMFSIETGENGWVFAIDIAPRFIEHINQECARLDLHNVTGVLCPENGINLPPNSVDTVFVCDTYHHFEYPKSSLASIHRALKDGGHLIVIDFDRIPGVSREWLIGHVRAGKDEFRLEIEDAGFSLDEEKKIAGFQENYFLKFSKN